MRTLIVLLAYGAVVAFFVWGRGRTILRALKATLDEMGQTQKNGTSAVPRTGQGATPQAGEVIARMLASVKAAIEEKRAQQAAKGSDVQAPPGVGQPTAAAPPVRAASSIPSALLDPLHDPRRTPGLVGSEDEQDGSIAALLYVLAALLAAGAFWWLAPESVIGVASKLRQVFGGR